MHKKVKSMKKSLSPIVVIVVLMASIAWGLSEEEWFHKGYQASEAGNLDEAIRCYKNAIAIDPNYAPAYNNLGGIYGNKGMLDDAIVEYNKAIDIDPDYTLAHNNLARAHRQKGNNHQSIPTI
jgi:tetratricopeptide (TPR) repeat protein